MKRTALLVIDLINEIVDEKGALASHGYHSFMKTYNIKENVNRLIHFSRNTDYILPIFVRVSFSIDYREQLKESPIFRDADKYGIFKQNTWSTEFYENLDVTAKDIIITKYRVSPFYGTNLRLILDNYNLKDLLVCGVSTHLAIETTVREAHDMGFKITVIEDCCISQNKQIHDNSIFNIKHFASVISLETFIKTTK